jgi:hypothetical protein
LRGGEDTDGLDVIELVPGSAVVQATALCLRDLRGRASSNTGITGNERREKSEDRWEE